MVNQSGTATITYGERGLSMKALRIHAWGAAPRLDDVDVPKRSDGETLVRVAAASLSHFDMSVASGDFGISADLPYVPGVDGAGVVVDSATWPAGARVAVRGGGIGIDRPGTWAEYVVVPDDAVVAVPDGLDLTLAAVAHDPLTTAFVTLHSVSRLGTWTSAEVSVPQDEVVLVTGAAGAVGSIVVQLAVRAGARVLALVSSAARADLVPDVAEIVMADDHGSVAAIAAEQPVTLLVDTIGGRSLAERLTWVRPGGRAAVVGYTAGTEAALDLPNWLLGDVSVLPVNMIRRGAEGAAAESELFDLLLDGSLTLQHESFTMTQAVSALTALSEGRVRGKAVLLPGV